MNSKNVRIKDIARLAGVSVGTVDRVLHQRGNVSPDALEKVNKVLAQIDYKPNLLARTLGSNKNFRIAALLPDPRFDPYWDQARLGIDQAKSEWQQYGVTVEIFMFDLLDKTLFQKTAHQVIQSNPDGIIIAPIFYHESLSVFELIKQAGIPVVLFNTNISEANPISFIGQDLYQSGKVGAELLHFGQNGNGTFAILHIDEDVHDSVHLVEKEKGFRAYFEEKKLNNTIVEFALNPKEPSFKKQLHQLIEDNSLRGIFVSTSNGTAVTASFLKKQGKNNIRLVGYDILEDNLKYLEEGIIDFLINQNPKRQAALGISHLANYLIFKKQAPLSDLFPLEVITQQNVGSYLSSGIH
jgi:LacI family transcriptional regulator